MTSEIDASSNRPVHPKVSGAQRSKKIRARSNLVGDVIEGPGDMDQQPGMTAEFFLCTHVRRTRSRLWDMTSLGLHQSTRTCGSFLRYQGGGPQVRAATSPQQRATLRNLISLAVSRLNRLLQQHQENSQERYSRDDGECREGPEVRIAGPKYEQTINGHCPRTTPRHRTGYRRTQACLRRAPTNRRTT